MADIKKIQINKKELDKIICLSLKTISPQLIRQCIANLSDALNLQKKFYKFRIINKIKPSKKSTDELDLQYTDSLLLVLSTSEV